MKKQTNKFLPIVSNSHPGAAKITEEAELGVEAKKDAELLLVEVLLAQDV